MKYITENVSDFQNTYFYILSFIIFFKKNMTD